MRQALLVALAFGLAILGGCATLRLSYSQSDQLTYWWLDGYADFNSAQTPRVRAALAEGLRWHRTTQLPDILAQIERASAEATEPATAAQMCRWHGDLVQRASTAFEHFLPALAELTPTLTPQQLQHLEHKYEKNNEKFVAEYLQSDPEDRLKAAVKRAVDRAEMLYGRIERAPRERIAAGVAQSPFDPQLQLEEHRRLQHEVLDTLRRLKAEGANPMQIQAAWRGVAQHMVVSPNEAHRVYQQRLLAYNCALAAQVHNASPPPQRQRAAKRLKSWADDLRPLLLPAVGA